jgi:predicted peroxiredoxin
MSDAIDTLIITGYGRNNGEKATIPFVLANIEIEDRSKRVEVVLMFDAAPLAVKGAADGFNIGPPFETHDLATRMRLFMEGGGILSVCTPCLVHRGIDNEPTLDGIVRINGRVVMEKKDRANRILSFA